MSHRSLSSSHGEALNGDSIQRAQPRRVTGHLTKSVLAPAAVLERSFHEFRSLWATRRVLPAKGTRARQRWSLIRAPDPGGRRRAGTLPAGMTTERRLGSGLLVLAGVLSVCLWSGPAGAAPLGPSRAVALVMVRDLTWSTAPPMLDGFARANVSMRTVEPQGGAADVYLTLGKGSRTSAPDDQGLGRVEVRPGGDLRLLDWGGLLDHDQRSRFPGTLGAVGQSLFESGRNWALVASDREAAAVAATSWGAVPESYPGTADGLERALLTWPDVLFVATSPGALPRVLDRLVGRCSLVVSVSTEAGNRHLGVFAASPACGLGTGGLASPSTHHDQLVTLPDVTSTLMALAGVDQPASASGHPARPAAGVARAELVGRDHRAWTADRARPAFVWLFVALHAAGAVTVVRWRRARPVVCSALLAIPAAGFLMMLVPWWRAGTPAGLLAGASFAAAIAVPAFLLVQRDRTLGVAALAALTAGVVAVDALFGSPLQVDAPFGNSPVTGARFFGVGNIGSGFLVAGLLVAGGLALDRWGRRAWFYVAAALAAGAVAGGAPQFGADVGGVLFAVPAYGLLLLGIRTPQLRLRHLALLAGAAVVAVALFAAVDLARDAGEQTHVAKALGLRGLADDVVRKATLAARTLGNPMGLVVAAALAALALTRYSPGSRPAIRCTSYAVVAAAALGSLLNDSGVIVAASVGAVAWPAGVLVASGSREQATSTI